MASPHLESKRMVVMETTTSSDGTRLAYDKSGNGPPVILLQGAFNDRQTTAPLARALVDFTVLNLDRRGRGDSGDTAPYAVEREVEDLAALIGAAGGRAALFGYSSGANLAVQAAVAGLPITKLALYEPAYNAHDSDPLLPVDLPERLTKLVDADDRGAAVELYQTVAVGLPDAVVEQLRHAPFRPAMEAIAHTLAYDAAVVGDRSLPSDLGTVRCRRWSSAVMGHRRSCATPRKRSPTSSPPLCSSHLQDRDTTSIRTRRRRCCTSSSLASAR
jgi:hypothetical protein